MSFLDPLFNRLSTNNAEGVVQGRQPDEEIEILDPFQLDIDDDELVRVIDERIEKSEAFYEKLDYQGRREKNKNFLFGQQIDNAHDKRIYESKYQDNVIYEAENTIKPIALSRLPDLFVKPGNDSDESKKAANDLTEVINSDVRKRENRRVLSVAFKHQPVFFQGCIKAIWDPKIGDNGDYRFKVVHPENIVVDHFSTTNNEADMEFIAEEVEISAKEMIMMFPDKKDVILDKIIGKAAVKEGGDKLEKKMASKYKMREVWFTYYKDKRDPETGESKFERIDGVAWKYRKILLGKMKNPYYDFEGETRMFTLELGKKRELNEEDIRAILLGGQMDVSQQQFFNNFFTDPKKPYIFLNYDQFGEHPLDYTTRIEQVIPLQKALNKRGQQIEEMNDRAKGKNVFNAKLIDKKTAESMDMNDPDEDVMVTGNVRDAHTFIPGQPAPAQLFNEQALDRDKIFQKEGVNSTTRGVREGNETATARQIFREADFGKIDDQVEDMINYAAEEMAAWSLQFIKLFYTRDHMRKLLGKDGEVTFVAINRDMVDNGMEVVTSASGVDKSQLKRDAFERARLQFTDPMSFFIDTDATNPVERTERLLLFIAAPELYLKTIKGEGETEDMAAQLQQISQQQIAAQGAQAPVQPPVQGNAQPGVPAAPPQGGGGNVNPVAQRVQTFMAKSPQRLNEI